MYAVRKEHITILFVLSMYYWNNGDKMLSKFLMTVAVNCIPND
jgi:hypothetical protein